MGAEIGQVYVGFEHHNIVFFFVFPFQHMLSRLTTYTHTHNANVETVSTSGVVLRVRIIWSRILISTGVLLRSRDVRPPNPPRPCHHISREVGWTNGWRMWATRCHIPMHVVIIYIGRVSSTARYSNWQKKDTVRRSRNLIGHSFPKQTNQQKTS